MGCEALDATIVFEKGVDQVITQYYDYMVARQKNNIGYPEPLLLLDQLNLFLTKDTNSATRGKLIEDLIYAVAVHLTDNRIPLGDVLKKYDTQSSG